MQLQMQAEAHTFSYHQLMFLFTSSADDSSIRFSVQRSRIFFMSLLVPFQPPLDGMGENNQIIDIDKVCRSCLSQNGEMRSIFGTCLDEMLRKVAQVEVEASDGLPEIMCFQCVLQVSRAFRFKQQCQRSDSTLRSYLNRTHKSTTDGFSQKEEIANERDSSSGSGSNCILIISSEVESDATANNVENDHNSLENDCTNSLKDSFGFSHEGECVSEDDRDLSCRIVGDEIEPIEPTETNRSEFDYLPIPETYPAKKKKELTNSATLQCNICSKMFNKKQVLRRHLKIHDPKKPHVCSDCGMSFTESSNLTKHRKKHTGELRNVIGKPNLCSVCGKAFKWASSLSKHMNHHTKRKVLNCPHCPKYYLERQTLKLHMRTHTGERPFVCNVCEKSFTQMSNLDKHFRIHTGEKPFECPFCDKRFTQSSYVTIHMRLHTGEKPYMCNECGKCFAGSNTLERHKRTHSAERPFCCNICGKYFARLETATIHQRTHTGEKPHYCNVCNRAFISSRHLSNHKHSHTNNKIHQCQQCNETFPSMNSFKVHLKSQCSSRVVDSLATNLAPDSQLLSDTFLVISSADLQPHLNLQSKNQFS